MAAGFSAPPRTASSKTPDAQRSAVSTLMARGKVQVARARVRVRGLVTGFTLENGGSRLWLPLHWTTFDGTGDDRASRRADRPGNQSADGSAGGHFGDAAAAPVADALCRRCVRLPPAGGFGNLSHAFKSLIGRQCQVSFCDIASFHPRSELASPPPARFGRRAVPPPPVTSSGAGSVCP